MKCKLTRVKSTHNNLRSDVIIGECDRPPMVGYEFYMEADPFEADGGRRYVRTTPVVSFEPDVKISTWLFNTRNSTYLFEEL